MCIHKHRNMYVNTYIHSTRKSLLRTKENVTTALAKALYFKEISMWLAYPYSRQSCDAPKANGIHSR